MRAEYTADFRSDRKNKSQTKVFWRVRASQFHFVHRMSAGQTRGAQLKREPLHCTTKKSYVIFRMGKMGSKILIRHFSVWAKWVYYIWAITHPVTNSRTEVIFFRAHLAPSVSVVSSRSTATSSTAVDAACVQNFTVRHTFLRRGTIHHGVCNNFTSEGSPRE